MNGHPYRLRRIELRDFKSVAKADVQLAPLTAVVGANSSGKSTLLQSILALTQAVRSGTSSAEFPLNGGFVRLGTFDETHNFRSESPVPSMRIAFDLVGPGFRPRAEVQLDASGRPHRERSLFTWRARLAGQADDRSEESGFARLESLQIEVSSLPVAPDEKSVFQFACDLHSLGAQLTDSGSLRTHPRLSELSAPRVAPGPMFRSTGGLLAAEGRIANWLDGSSAPVDAVSLSGGLPSTVWRRQERFEGLANLWWDVATDVLSEDIQQLRDRATDSQAPMRASYKAVIVAAKHIAELVELSEVDYFNPHTETFETPREWLLRALASMPQNERRAVAKSLFLVEQPEYRKRLRKDLGDAPWIDEIEFVAPLGDAGDALRKFGRTAQRTFGESIRYLGPLREAPHVLYDPGPSRLDLGVAGEYTAAVLHAQTKTEIWMPTPTAGRVRRPLGEALNFWLQEFGLSDSAQSNDRGRMGIALSVTPAGTNRTVDLTSVGVGVSQVLPVMLVCLLARPGDVVILEQPELHLHPKLQQDLADFLLACTKAGRQIILETHSEHLINRLRYRIAEDETDETHNLVGLVFAENENGITRYREPEVNEFGGLGDDWPAGFLDLTARQSQDLVRASLAKRRRAEAARAAEEDSTES